jgi:hypothetical protein
MISDKTVKLDPRKARKLTDRACANILGGWVGAMATSTLYSTDQVRQALIDFAANDELWGMIRQQASQSSGATHDKISQALGYQAEDAESANRLLWRSLGGVVSGLRVLSSERAVRKAVIWWIQQDDQWAQISKERGE